MLTGRRARILGFVVDEYVNSVQPVGSQTLAKKYHLPISPATVRNEMVRLEKDGYIAQPHTSAGRIPSDKGYRYYVETLMGEPGLPSALQQTIRHQFHQTSCHLEEWIHLAATTLSHETENLAVVTAPHSRQARLRWLDLVPLQSLLVTLVTMMHGAQIRQQTVPLDSPLGKDDLTSMVRKLNSLFCGLTAGEIRKQKPLLSSAEQAITDTLVAQMRDEEEAQSGLTKLAGLRQLFQQPEFDNNDQIIRVLAALEDHNLHNLLLPNSIPDDGVTIIIGSEHPDGSMRQYSLVIARYGGQLGVGGTIAILGPTRMNYRLSASMVRYTASLMSEFFDNYLT